MQVTIKDRQPVEATVEVVIPAEQVNEAYDQVLRQLSGQVRIPGFRPGKVPAAVLERRVGAEALGGEVRQMLIDGSAEAALKEAELNPIGLHYHGGTPSRGEDFSYDIHMDLAPEFELPDTDAIKLESAAEAVTDEDVQAAVANLRRRHATLLPVERPAQEHDSLLLETLGADGDAGNTMPFEMDSVSDDLRQQLLGRAAGEEFDLVLDMTPPNTEVPEGEERETSSLRVRIADVRERELPAEDDEFASTLGFETWQAVLDYIGATLREQRAEDTFREQRREFTDHLLGQVEFDVPSGLLNQRSQFMLQQLHDDLARRGSGLEPYLAGLREKGELEKFEEDLKASARDAVRRDLLVERIMLDRQTVLNDEEFEREVAQMAASEGMSARDLLDSQGEEWASSYRHMLRREKALDEAVRQNLAAAAVAALE